MEKNEAFHRLLSYFSSPGCGCQAWSGPPYSVVPNSPAAGPYSGIQMSHHSQRQQVFLALCSPPCFPSHPQAIMCSCFIPLYFGFFPPTYHGVRYVDGELGMWRANFTSRTTITVSAFAGEYDICPKDSPAAFFNFQLSDCILQISKRNICRLQCIFRLPTYQVLDQFYIHGYQDTVSFLKRLSDFGVNYLDEDFMLSLGNESCQKGERTLHWKPETRLLCSRATDLEDVTEENPGTIRAADEVEEEVPHHLLHRQKGSSRTSGLGESPLLGQWLLARPHAELVGEG
uniref:Uncharacterized protein n=1 Tax=Falco tinnunculus TaxID=100819 RepID=A0A8C4V3D9_FALTI